MTQRSQCVRVWAETGAPGARRGASRGDVVVIVDALRASVTIAAALQAGAQQVIPVATLEEATAFLDDPDVRVAGERGGAEIPQFHLGNSPRQFLAAGVDLAGRKVVLTTSNGTRCVHAALPGAYEVLIGSAVNAAAVADVALATAWHGGRDVTLVAAGLDDEPASEDTQAVALIGHRLAQRGARLMPSVPALSLTKTLDVFTSSDSASRLASLGYTGDVLFCAQVDLWDVVPVLRDGGFIAQPWGQG